MADMLDDLEAEHIIATAVNRLKKRNVSSDQDLRLLWQISLPPIMICDGLTKLNSSFLFLHVGNLFGGLPTSPNASVAGSSDAVHMTLT